MIETIVKNLEANSVDAWRIREENIESEEYFFVGNKADLGRAKKVKKYQVTVYRDFEEGEKKYRGSSTVTVNPGTTVEEIVQLIQEAFFAAGFVKNPWYPMAPGFSRRFETAEHDLHDLSRDAIGAIFYNEKPSNSWLNSVEIFVTRNGYHILNSEGLDVTFSKYRTYIESIVSSSGREEVELYDQFLLALPDAKRIRERISRLLLMVCERANAVPTPTLDRIPVVLTGEPAKEVMRYYLKQANARLKYDRISEVEPGDSVQSGESGDKIALEVVPELEGSYFSLPVDNDGFLIEKRTVIENGILKDYWGDIKYSHYLGIEPTGAVLNFSVGRGSLSIDEMRKVDHLEVTNFSAVDVDETTGDFGGEIRLGWYFDGSERIAVSGGSVTGNLRELDSIYLSKETELDGDYYGPISIAVEGLKISGE